MEDFSDSEGNVVKVPDMVPIRGTERVRGLTCGGEGHVRGGKHQTVLGQVEEKQGRGERKMGPG